MVMTLAILLPAVVSMAAPVRPAAPSLTIQEFKAQLKVVRRRIKETEMQLRDLHRQMSATDDVQVRAITKETIAGLLKELGWLKSLEKDLLQQIDRRESPIPPRKPVRHP